MSTSPPAPRVEWLKIRSQVEKDAQTMTSVELAAKYKTNRPAVHAAMARLGIEPKKAVIDWAAREEEVRNLATTMTAEEMAAHLEVPLASVYSVLHRYSIKSMRKPIPPKFCGGLPELKRLAATMTAKQLSEHFAISPATVAKHLKNLKVSCLPETRGRWANHIEEIKRLVSEGQTYDQLAQRFDCSVSLLRGLLSRNGLHIKQPMKSGPRNPKAPAPRKSAPKEIKQTKPAPQLTLKAAATVVMPETVKFTRLPFNPPTDCRFCNGTSPDRYQPALHGGATTSYRR